MKNNAKIFFIITFLLILLDQATKLTVKGFSCCGIEYTGLMYGQLVSVIGDILQFTYIENEGMAFGISFGQGKILLSLFSFIASGFIAYYLYALCKISKSNLLKFSIVLILAGAFGNGIDRNFYGVLFDYAPLFYGRVVDFILVDIPDVNFLGLNYSHFPVFNVADSCVTCGVILLFLVHKQLPDWEEVFPKKKKIGIEDNKE